MFGATETGSNKDERNVFATIVDIFGMKRRAVRSVSKGGDSLCVSALNFSADKPPAIAPRAPRVGRVLTTRHERTKGQLARGDPSGLK